MGKPGGHGGKKGKKVRVAFRRNRTKPARRNDWTEQAHQADGHEIDAQHSESVVPKGELSRQRTVKADEDKEPPSDLQHGVVLAMRGLYADVDDGDRIWPCTVRRVLRTRLIEQRHPVTVGDRVGFRVDPAEDDRAGEGVIEWVRPRQGELCRRVGRRIHTIVANVDQAIIVSSAGQPDPRPNLIDRYIVASLAGRITPVVCMNKIDLDQAGCAASLLKVYAELGYEALVTSAIEGTGITELRGVLAGKASVVVGQSGVGKSSLLNMVQPGLQLRTGEISEQVNKGRHVTTTASLIRLEIGRFRSGHSGDSLV